MAAPTFSVAEGTYGPAQTVSLSTTTPSAIIYYTTNGQAPTTTSSVYSAPITVSSTTTIKAFATKANFSDSPAASATYTINGQVATPTASVTPGSYSSAQSVTLSTSTPGASIYYTTDGTPPTASNTTYTGPISVATTQTIKAIAIKTNYTDSEMRSFDYTISSPLLSSRMLSVWSGSASGSGTTIDPYLVQEMVSPSPIYVANAPGLLTVSFTSIRTGSYACDDESGCKTGRFNESVYFKFPNGLFYEQIRSNISNLSTGNTWDWDLTDPNLNTLTAISYPVYKGQQIRLSQHSLLTDGARSAPDSNRQLTNARISMIPSSPNFSISSIGSRSFLGNGTASSPFVNATHTPSNRNERTAVFRANGNGVVAFTSSENIVPLGYGERPIIWFGGTHNSFAGSIGKNRLDFFNFTNSPWNTINRPAYRNPQIIYVNDGDIFSIADYQCEDGECWYQEPNLWYGPLVVWAVPGDAEDGLWLMNYAPSYPSTNPIGWQGNSNNPTYWSGNGTVTSPASMNSWSGHVHMLGWWATIYSSLKGSITFNYEIENQICDEDSGACWWPELRVQRSWYIGALGNRHHGKILSETNVSQGSRSGAVTLSLQEFNGINFSCQNRFKITNLVFTPNSYSTVPSAPASVTTAEPEVRQISVLWTPPLNDGGSAIKDYLIQYSSDNGFTWTTFNDGVSTNGNTTVTGLTAGIPHIFRVAAVNSSGTGIFTKATVSTIPLSSATVPFAPRSPSPVQFGSSCVPDYLINFTPPSSHGGAVVSSYRIRTQSDNYTTHKNITIGQAFGSLTGLVNYSSWNGGTVRLSAVNSVGEGPYVQFYVGPTTYQCGD